jgi:hypothetical protein
MKVECDIVVVKGREVIWCNREDREYWSSSSSEKFSEDFLNGDVFEVEVVFEGSRKEVSEKEVELLTEVDAANNPLYYNLSNQSLHRLSQTKIANRYGETLKDVANCKSSSSKRDSTARKLGFLDSSYLAEHIYTKHMQGMSFASISRELGKDRHFAKIYISRQDMSTFLEELEAASKDKVREMFALGATLSKISEDMGIGYFTARRLLGEYAAKGNRRFLVAENLNYTKEELGVVIVKKFLEGSSLGEISDELDIQETTTRRYFHSCLRERLKASDFE